MWDAPRHPGPGLRGHPRESFPPRIYQGSHPRMRGRPPFHLQAGPRVSNPHFGGPGVAPFMHRDIDGRWEEGRMMHEEQLHLSRRARLDMHYEEMRGTENQFQARLVPDMDYRAREASMLEQRGIPDVDYRREEGPAIAYRVKLPPPPIFRERESMEYRRRLLAEMELREREQHRQRVTAALEYTGREEMEFKHRLDVLQEMVLRQRGTSDREASDMLLREQEEMLRDRSALDLMERGGQAHFRESADMDLRFRKPDAARNFMDQDRGQDYRERMVIDYSYNQGAAQSADYKTGEKLVSDTSRKEMAGRDLESTSAAYKNRDIEIPGINSDSDYREKESADSDYREKETSDSDYRDRENTNLNYRKVINSDYKGKASADSDYRERESADADYRKSTDGGVKKSATKMKDNISKPAKDQKELESVMAAPDLASQSLSSTEQRIPFLSYDEPETSPLPEVNKKAAPPEGAPSSAKRGVQSKSETCSYPGKLDVDFRDRPKPEDLHQETKETPSKVMRYSADSKNPCPSDQDLRKKTTAPDGGDQDFRTGKYTQKKDEDFRAGENQALAAGPNQNVLLYDFIRLAAKELRQQREKSNVGDETKGEAAVRTPAKLPAARTSHPGSSTVKSAGAGGHSPGVEFLGRLDTDYRNKDYNDVDLRVGCGPSKKPHEDPQPGSKDKDYRRTAIPDGATRVIWLEDLPTGASREEILAALAGTHPLPEHGVNLIGYIPGYSFGSVCVEFSLVEEAVGCMEANKGVLHFKGKKVNLKYIPNSDRWNCQQCKGVNVLSKERCWQCSALRAGSDHLPLRDTAKDAKTPPFLTAHRAKKRKARLSPPPCSPDRRKNRSPPPKSKKGAKPAESATIIIRGIGVKMTPESVVKALQPYVQLSVRNVRLMKNRKNELCFIDLKNHKEAIRLTVLVRELKPPLTINGKLISVDLAVGERRNEQGKSQKGSKTSTAKNQSRRAQRKAIAYPGFRAAGDDGSSYVYDPKTGMYVDPLTNTYYSGDKTQRKKDDSSHRTPGTKNEPSTQPRRGFTEDVEKDSEEDPFKRPLPPLVTKKEEPPPEPKANPLIKLLGEYGDDSEEEEEEEEEPLPPPPLKRKPASPPPAPIPKPAPKPAPPTSSPVIIHEDKLIDWKKIACLLCRRQFPNKDTLIRHQKLSDLHKQNLAIQEKIRKSQKELAYLEQEENQSIQRRLLQARKELEMLERQEESTQQVREGLDSELQGPGKRIPKGPETASEQKPKVKKPVRESYRDNMKRRILERYKELE